MMSLSPSSFRSPGNLDSFPRRSLSARELQLSSYRVQLSSPCASRAKLSGRRSHGCQGAATGSFSEALRLIPRDGRKATRVWQLSASGTGRSSAGHAFMEREKEQQEVRQEEGQVWQEDRKEVRQVEGRGDDGRDAAESSVLDEDVSERGSCSEEGERLSQESGASKQGEESSSKRGATAASLQQPPAAQQAGETGQAEVEAGREADEAEEKEGMVEGSSGEEAKDASKAGGSEGGADEKKDDDDDDGHGDDELGDGDDVVMEQGYKMSRVCDRLIEVFWIEKPQPEEWRKLLAFSEEWGRIRPYFFKRCRERAREMEGEQPGRSADLFKLARRLKEVDESMQQHDKLFAFVEENEDAIEGIVARRRTEFTGEFFGHLRLLCDAAYDNPNRQQEIAQLAAKCLTAVEMHDKMMADEEAVGLAQQRFEDILNSPSLEAACKKIDDLAARQELDSPLMLMITKAWAAAKESNMMKDEVKDILYHLYMNARANMQLLVPKEVRIIRHILSIDDPRERFAALTDAFSPGVERAVQDETEDLLHTTPEELLQWIERVLEAYYSNQATTLIQEARRLLKPAAIQRLEIVKDVIIDQFM